LTAGGNRDPRVGRSKNPVLRVDLCDGSGASADEQALE